MDTPEPLKTFFIVTTRGDGLAQGRTLEEAAAPFMAPVRTFVVGREATANDLRGARPFRPVQAAPKPGNTL